MSSGNKNILFNQYERALSTDMNRLQAFSAANLSETLRNIFHKTYTPDTSAGFDYEENTGIAPLEAIVLGGLLVQPGLGIQYIAVNPGKLLWYYTDATTTTDDSNYQLIESSGLGFNSNIAILDNEASPYIRIDVIECSPTLGDSVVVESDNRDIYTPSTQTWAATNVTKVQSTSLTYRVRQGVPGSGIPNNQSGWLPLAIASVPAGYNGTDTDSITFWDVRPLAVDLAVAPFQVNNFYRRDIINQTNVVVESPPNAARCLISGLAETTYGVYKAGGVIFGIGDCGYIDVLDTKNQDPNLSTIPYTPWYLYAAFPGGLPRWVKYTETDIYSFGCRVPGPFRGVPIISTTPCGPTGYPDTSRYVITPTALGLGNAQCINAVVVTSGIIDSSANLQGYSSDGHMQYFPYSNITGAYQLLGSPKLYVPNESSNTIPGGPYTSTDSVLSSTTTYTFIPGIDFPKTATRLKLMLATSDTYNLSGGTTRSSTIYRNVSLFLDYIPFGMETLPSRSLIFSALAGSIDNTNINTLIDLYKDYENLVFDIPINIPNYLQPVSNIQITISYKYFLDPIGVEAMIYYLEKNLILVGWDIT